jgi:hypothetical protein
MDSTRVEQKMVRVAPTPEKTWAAIARKDTKKSLVSIK